MEAWLNSRHRIPCGSTAADALCLALRAALTLCDPSGPALAFATEPDRARYPLQGSYVSQRNEKGRWR
jgi:hypothetical protein